MEPIRDKKKISQIKNQIEGAKRYRDLLLFIMGINTALRISDLLQMHVGDFMDRDGTILEQFSIREEKREKRNVIVINNSMRDALKKYQLAYPKALEKRVTFCSSPVNAADRITHKP